MNYKQYKQSRNLAWEILIRERITELPVNVVSLCRKMGIRVQYYTPQDDNDGYSTIFLGMPRIFVSGRCSSERQRFTIAHELGHILLGHVGARDLVNREPTPTDNPIEQAANVFASRLLAPACVLWGLNLHDAADIARVCRISMQAAAYRAQRMEELYRRNKFLSHPLERQVYTQFLPYIRDHQVHPGADPALPGSKRFDHR